MHERKALIALRSGSEDALGWFIQKYTPYVTTIINNIIGSSMDMADVEEVAADVFFTFWQNAELVRSVKGYLGTLARNKAKNKLRELGCSLPLDEHILVIDELTPETRLEKQELETAVKKAVMTMPYPDREIFLRYYYYYQTMGDISTEMGVNLSTVKTKLHRGRAKLKESLIRYLA